LLRFQNSKWLQHSNQDDFETITIHLDSIQTENKTISQLEKIKELYTNETGKTVIDKQYSQ
jgi:hypothetical protein